MRSKVLIAASAAFVAASAATPTLGETLNDVLAKAYAGNPTLEAQRAALRAQDESVAQALSGRRPSVSLSTSIGRSNTAADTVSNATPPAFHFP